LFLRAQGGSKGIIEEENMREYEGYKEKAYKKNNTH
jgi:hypothetical protein